MDRDQSYREANRDLWNELARLHPKTLMYNLEGFRSGDLTLKSLERLELGDVAGKSLLHLQCHFGLDTLSWARLGAQVTGVDFADEAIALARKLSEELRIPAVFVCSDVYDLPGRLSGQFDIVFTSYGVLAWLPDLSRWAQVVSHFLRPGGIFYIVEEHPGGNIFDDDAQSSMPTVRFSYFEHGPLTCQTEGSYADRTARLTTPVSYQWTHTLGDVINGLVQAGLRLEFLHELPFCNYQRFPFLLRGEDGWWRPATGPELPLLFSLRARKEQNLPTQSL